MPLDGNTPAHFKIKPESLQASRYNYQFIGNTNKGKQHVNYTAGMQSEKSSLQDTAGQMAHFTIREKIQMVGEGIIQRLQIPINQMQCMDFIWILIYFLFFWLLHAACRILVPQPGVGPSAVRTQSPNHWIVRGIVEIYILIISFPFLPSDLTTSHVTMTSLLEQF